MVVNFKVFKKCSPNNMITLYMNRREFVDSVTQVEPIDGIVVLDDEYVRQNRKIFVQLVCNFRYGREDDEMIGLRFQKELTLVSQQVCPQQKQDLQLTKMQERLLKKLGSNAFPFIMQMPPSSPASVVLQQKASDESQPCGVQYFVKIFTGDSDCDRSHRRSTINLGIRKVQYAPTKQGIQPCTVVRKDFLLSPGELELEVTLDKQLYHHGEKIAVNICVRNNSNKVVKKVKAMVQQGVDVVLFQNGQFRNTIAFMETSEGCPLNPGSSLQKVMYLVPTLVANCDRAGIAVEGDIKRKDTALASTTLIASQDARDAFGIIVSYAVKVKLFLGALGGELCAELPFILMHPKALPLTPTSKTFEKWEELPIPVYVYMYLWNWTNADDVSANGVKPIFEQLGPYVYREERKKMDLEWHDNNTVTFNPRRTWFWEEELSGGKQSDIVTVPHLPSIAAASQMRDSPKLIKLFFNQALNSNGGCLAATHTAAEWLFDGFYDEFLHYAMELNNPLAPAIEDDHFAWFLNRNGSKDFEGAFTVHTGVGNIKQMGDIQFWKGQNHTGWYEGDCGRLNGSTTDLFVPDEPLEKALTIFIPDTCRIINLEFTGESYEIEGITGWKYEVTPNTFDNGQVNGHMKCYCPLERQPDNCPQTGATDLSPCADGVPMFLSADHFMYADESYSNTIIGFQPDYEKNNFFIIMERKLGVPMQVNAAVMITLYMEADNDIDILKGIPSFYAPLFTTASRAVINKELAKELKLALNLPTIGRYTGVGMLCLGIILIGIGIILTCKRKWHGQSAADKAALIHHQNEPESGGIPQYPEVVREEN